MTAPAAPPADSLDASKLRYVDVDGLRTRYYEDGQGEPLVIFSGGQFGQYYCLDHFSRNFPLLTDRFHVYAVDKLGQGYTDNPRRPEDYTFDAVVQHAAGFFRAVGITRAHLMGHSRGALLVARLALDHPGLASTVVLLSTSTLAPDDPQWGTGSFYADIDQRVAAEGPTRAAVRMEPEANSFGTAHITDDWVSRLHAIAQLSKIQEATRVTREVGERIFIHSLNRIKGETLATIDERGLPAPTLMFWGVNDPSARLPLAFLLLNRIAPKTPRTELHVVNQAGHYAFREHPDVLARLLKGFCLQ
jgi:2-hydroxy-6-oxonona-2,4-dienedioate hydrolase